MSGDIHSSKFDSARGYKKREVVHSDLLLALKSPPHRRGIRGWVTYWYKISRDKSCLCLFLYPRAESNCYLRFRKPSFYPLNYRGFVLKIYEELDLQRSKDTKKYTIFVQLTMKNLFYL